MHNGNCFKTLSRLPPEIILKKSSGHPGRKIVQIQQHIVYRIRPSNPPKEHKPQKNQHGAYPSQKIDTYHVHITKSFVVLILEYYVD